MINLSTKYFVHNESYIVRMKLRMFFHYGAVKLHFKKHKQTGIFFKEF